MARFADTRQHRRTPADPARADVTLRTRVTLYGSGINPGHIRLHPGDTATLVRSACGWSLEWTDDDGTTYTANTQESSYHGEY